MLFVTGRGSQLMVLSFLSLTKRTCIAQRIWSQWFFILTTLTSSILCLTHCRLLLLFNKANKLSLNVKKTCPVMFSIRKGFILSSRKGLNTHAPQLYQVFSCCLLLGYFIDNILDWKHHIDYVSSKRSIGVCIFNRLRFHLRLNSVILSQPVTILRYCRNR